MPRGDLICLKPGWVGDAAAAVSRQTTVASNRSLVGQVFPQLWKGAHSEGQGLPRLCQPSGRAEGERRKCKGLSMSRLPGGLRCSGGCLQCEQQGCSTPSSWRQCGVQSISPNIKANWSGFFRRALVKLTKRQSSRKLAESVRAKSGSYGLLAAVGWDWGLSGQALDLLLSWGHDKQSPLQRPLGDAEIAVACSPLRNG